MVAASVGIVYRVNGTGSYRVTAGLVTTRRGEKNAPEHAPDFTMGKTLRRVRCTGALAWKKSDAFNGPEETGHEINFCGDSI